MDALSNGGYDRGNTERKQARQVFCNGLKGLAFRCSHPTLSATELTQVIDLKGEVISVNLVACHRVCHGGLAVCGEPQTSLDVAHQCGSLALLVLPAKDLARKAEAGFIRDSAV